MGFSSTEIILTYFFNREPYLETNKILKNLFNYLKYLKFSQASQTIMSNYEERDIEFGDKVKYKLEVDFFERWFKYCGGSFNFKSLTNGVYCSLFNYMN